MVAMFGLERAIIVGESFGGLIGARPEPPFAYLQTLAVTPEAQGRGLGGQVVRPGLSAAGDLGIPVYLETMKAEDLPFYDRLGFEVTSEFDLPNGGPHTWTMVRPSR